MSKISIGGKTIIPTRNRVILEMYNEEKVTDNGIIIPESAQKKINPSGIIAAISFGEKELTKNMEVVTLKNSGIELNTDSKSHKYKLFD